MSAEAARTYDLPLVGFLHYPPVWGDQVCEEFMTILTERRIRRCYYGHIHGAGIRRAVQGTVRGVELRLISGDSLSFAPLLVR